MAKLFIAAALCGLSISTVHASDRPHCLVLHGESSHECLPGPDSFTDYSTTIDTSPADSQVLDNAYEALAVLQRDYFDADYGTWPSTIDWTGAVVQTVMSGMLATLSTSLNIVDLRSNDWKAKENLISSHFAQVVNAFFGQDVLAIRGQAYDDMLWVVLGWLEAIQFVRGHGELHYPDAVDYEASTGGLKDALESMLWHGHNWLRGFAHRSRIFWNLAMNGWDTRLCDGGMVWNPRLEPYKNAITNELWISASISMYHHFPGDNFTSPWLNDVAFPKKDPMHLTAAIEGYRWLMGVNMTNTQGLFVDGYHINNSRPGNTECDVRDEMVYTYNQGVVLTGQRGLWKATGMDSYLYDGHRLVQSVINATGWSLANNAPLDEVTPPGQLPIWRGIGRGGILEEQCDASGTCSQDAQTFKAIFFHHFTTFCAPLKVPPVEGGNVEGFDQVARSHANACQSYVGWARYNALAALGTRNKDGHFGMWWGASIFNMTVSKDKDGIDHHAKNCTDYRNDGTPLDKTWGMGGTWHPGTGGWKMNDVVSTGAEGQQIVTRTGTEKHVNTDKPFQRQAVNSDDPNDRGRGRTAETQIGGLAVLRAYWELSQSSHGAGFNQRR